MIDLKFDNVSKRYKITHESEQANGNGLIQKFKRMMPTKEDFWAVRDVSFEVKKGETLGIIGHNGAGKSTILKLLANITTPTKGNITINGRLSALIEVGSGFHPELTGRENIYLNGAILGMRRSEISQKLDSIVDFAGIEKFLDIPIKRFSSGMYVRLGFSIAAHLNPDILLLDEVLAVGDAAFQKKCLQRINELKVEGTTIVFISHDLKAVSSVCDNSLLLKGGQIVKRGTSDEVIKFYESEDNFSTGSQGVFGLDSNHEAVIERLQFYSDEGLPEVNFKTGEKLKAYFDFEILSKMDNAIVRVVLHDPDGTEVCELTTPADGIALDQGKGRIQFDCKILGLRPGIYFADASIKRADGLESIHTLFNCSTIHVDAGSMVTGYFYQDHEWKQISR